MSSMFHTPRTAQRTALWMQSQQTAELKRAEEERLSKEERERVEKARKKAKGKAGTILTSGQGVTGEPSMLLRKKLLGQ